MGRLPPPGIEWLRIAYETMAIRNAELGAMSFESALTNPKWATVIHILARKKRTDHYVATTTRRERLVRRCHPQTHAWVTQRVPGDFDDHQPLLM